MTLVVCLFQHWDRISDNESRKSHFIYIDILIYWYIDIELLFIQHIQVIRCFPAQEETVSTRCDRNRENRYTSNRIIQPLRGTRTCSQQPSPHQEVDTEKKRIWTAPTPAELTSVCPHSSSHFSVNTRMNEHVRGRKKQFVTCGSSSSRIRPSPRRVSVHLLTIKHSHHRMDGRKWPRGWPGSTLPSDWLTTPRYWRTALINVIMWRLHNTTLYLQLCS